MLTRNDVEHVAGVRILKNQLYGTPKGVGTVERSRTINIPLLRSERFDLGPNRYREVALTASNLDP